MILETAMVFLRKKGSRRPGFTSLVTIFGVALGVCAFLVVVTVAKSLESELRETLSAANPHLLVHAGRKGISNPERFKKTLRNNLEEFKPTHLSPVFYINNALLSFSGNTISAHIRALDGERSASAKPLERFILPKGAYETLKQPRLVGGSKAEQQPAIILGNGLAERLRAKVGDVIKILSLQRTGDSSTQFFKVTGLLKLGVSTYDDKIALANYTDIGIVTDRTRATGLEVQFADLHVTEAAVKKLRSSDFPYVMRPWYEISAGTFHQIERDSKMVMACTGIITLVAIFNIAVTLILTVSDRSKQVALLRALGMRKKQIIYIFLIIGGVLGAAGAVIGSGLSYLILRLFQNLSLGDLSEFYFVSKIPVHLDSTRLVAVCLIAILCAMISAFIPAWFATRVSPLSGLRTRAH